MLKDITVKVMLTVIITVVIIINSSIRSRNSSLSSGSVPCPEKGWVKCNRYGKSLNERVEN